MTFCEMHKPSGCNECPNRFICEKTDREAVEGRDYINVPVYSENANEDGSHDIISYRREYVD